MSPLCPKERSLLRAKLAVRAGGAFGPRSGNIVTIIVGERPRQPENFLAAVALCAWQRGARGELFQCYPLSGRSRSIQKLALMTLDVRLPPGCPGGVDDHATAFRIRHL